MAKNPPPTRTAQLKQKRVLKLLTMPFYTPNGSMEASKLCTHAGINWQGKKYGNKRGDILHTALEFINWFVSQGLAETTGTGKFDSPLLVSITDKGLARLADLERVIVITPVEEMKPPADPDPATPKREPLDGVDSVAIQKRHGNAAADLARRQRIQARKMGGGQSAG